MSTSLPDLTPIQTAIEDAAEVFAGCHGHWTSDRIRECGGSPSMLEQLQQFADKLKAATAGTAGPQRLWQERRRLEQMELESPGLPEPGADD